MSLKSDVSNSWRLAESSDPAVLDVLANVSVEIIDLPGNLLGRATTSTIQIDVDAAGYGWFVDETPADNWEFNYDKNTRQFIADTHSPAAGHFDLLTVVMHELGHVLGHEHSDSDALMSAELPLGTRRLPMPHMPDFLVGHADDRLLNEHFFFDGRLFEAEELEKLLILFARQGLVLSDIQ